jgi:endonuclease-3 related protein
VFDRLKTYYGEFPWWRAQSAYEVMVGAVLTQNTNWNNVEKALNNLNGQLDPAVIERLPEAKLAELIRPSGFYNQKQVRLKALTRWFKQYDYDVDKLHLADKTILRQELLAISGIGPETADSILLYALGKPSFVIDAYTRRIFSRIGLEMPEDYVELQKIFVQALPEDSQLYAYYHALIVEHAKRFCKTKPACDGCPVRETCRYGSSA